MFFYEIWNDTLFLKNKKYEIHKGYYIGIYCCRFYFL